MCARPRRSGSRRREDRGDPPRLPTAGPPRAAPRAAANPGVQGYSPPPPPVSPIKGLIDFHTHAAPDVFGRAVDDDELAALAATRQMEAVVFKNHVTHTADRAWLVAQARAGHQGLRRHHAERRGGRPQPPGRRVDVAHAGRLRPRGVVPDLRRRQPRQARGGTAPARASESSTSAAQVLPAVREVLEGLRGAAPGGADRPRLRRRGAGPHRRRARGRLRPHRGHPRPVRRGGHDAWRT